MTRQTWFILACFRPQASWYKGEVQISDKPRFWQSTADGVCTLTIPSCVARDSGDYTLLLESPLGQARCSCNLLIFGQYLCLASRR